MDKLPGELILHIASYLDLERSTPHAPVQAGIPHGESTDLARFKQRRLAQACLAAWARTSKRYAALLTRLLYRNPILASPDKALSWSRTLRPIDPFSLSQTSSLHTKPMSLDLVYPPIQAICRADSERVWKAVSFLPSSPPPISAPLDAGLLDALTSITLEEVHLDNDFLPLLIGPGTAIRRRLELLSIRKCAPAPKDTAEPILSFVLEHFAGLTAYEIYEAGWEAGRHESPLDYDGVDPMHDDPLDAMDAEAHTNLVLEQAATDWNSFNKLWAPSLANTLSDVTEFAFSPDFPFSGLTTLQLTLPRLDYLHLIVESPLFPSLRGLKINSTDRSFRKIWPPTYLTERLLPALRYSITGPRSLPEGRRFHVFDGDEEVLEEVEPFQYEDRWGNTLEFFQPLSPHEMVTYKKPYVGPMLDWLDMSGTRVEFGDE